MCNKKHDKRLSAPLSISEFLTAFGKYKRIMCTAYPQWNRELDLYIGNIIQIYNTHGQVFYDYHKLFSAKCAEALRLHATKVDWSFLDTHVFTLVTSGTRAQTRDLCHSITQPCVNARILIRVTQNSPGLRMITPWISKAGKGFYTKARKSNFNGDKGCTKVDCSYLHICTRCKKVSHGLTLCKFNPTTKGSHTTE